MNDHRYKCKTKKSKIPCKKYFSFIPNMSINLNKNSKNNIGPQRLDLKEKTLKLYNKNKETDYEITNTTKNNKNRGDVKSINSSGPHSLICSLHNNPSVSMFQNSNTNYVSSEEQCTNAVRTLSDGFVEKLPNVLEFDDKDTREFEYSCENDLSSISFNKQTSFNCSRSDLSLKLKCNASYRNLDNLSPSDNSLSKVIEENSLDDSLGILTPDQMDDMFYIENAFSPSFEEFPKLGDKNDNKKTPDNSDSPSENSNSVASTIQNEDTKTKEIKTTNIDLCSSGEQYKFMLCAENKLKHDTSFDDVILNSSLDSLEKNDNLTLIVSKHNSLSEEFENKDTTIKDLNADVDCFMPSLKSSIVDIESSLCDTTVNLELSLDYKQETRLNRTTSTPSPEELPLDSSEIIGEVSTYSYPVSTIQDSQTFDLGKNEYSKSMETSKVSNSFITSVTSITSLDGYQGDGEMSRPVSRGADLFIGARDDTIDVGWQNAAVPRRPDPMTDSDFFTESDADGLEDNMHRGDRKAQVIDGALYGGKNANSNPLVVNRSEDSCMESSGVYTDCENNRGSPLFLNIIEDISAEDSSPPSECSQKNVVSNISANNTKQKDSINNHSSVSIKQMENNTFRRNSKHYDKDVKSNGKTKDEKRIFTLKKYKMPKRDVPSKLKSMLTSKNLDVDTSAQSSPKIIKKTENRDNYFINKTLDFKTKSYKDVKPKVDSSFPLQRSQTTSSVSRLSSLKGNSAVKQKRHFRLRAEPAPAHVSAKSSVHSSQSDLSAACSPNAARPPSHVAARITNRNAKKRDAAQTPAATGVRTPPAPASAPLPQQHTPISAKKNGMVQKLSSSPVIVRARCPAPAPPSPPRKQPPRRAPRTPTLPLKDPPRAGATTVRTKAQSPQVSRAPLAPQTPVIPPTPAPATPALTPQHVATLKHAANGFEAFSVLVQYLVFKLDGLNGDAWKQDASRWRGVAAAERAAAARAVADREMRAQKDLDTIGECLSKIAELEAEVANKDEAISRLHTVHMDEVSALADDIKGLKRTIDSLKHEVSESRARLRESERLSKLSTCDRATNTEETRWSIDHTMEKSFDQTFDQVNHTLDLSFDQTFDQSEDQVIDQTVDQTLDPIMNRLHDPEVSKSDAACDPICCEVEEYDLRFSKSVELSRDANELAAEVLSLRAVVELKQGEIASLREARAALAAEREARAGAERDARAARQAAEELRERATARQRDAARLRDENRRLRELAARDRDHAKRLGALNEELRYKLRQKSQVVSLLAGGGYVERAGVRARSSSVESARSCSPPPSPAPSPPAAHSSPPSPAVKAVVEKHDSVSWVLEIEETPEEVASRLARKSSFRASSSPSGLKRRGAGSPDRRSPALSSPTSPASPASPAPNASKLFRPGEIDFSHPPLKESAGEAIYIYDEHY